MENKQIIKKSILYFIGNLSSKVLTSLLVPIYAFYIIASDLGKFDYNQTIMNILIPILYIAIWESILRYVLNNDTGYDITTIISTSAFFVIVTSGIFLLLGYPILSFFYIDNLGFFMIMCLASAFAQIWQYFARAFKKNNLYVLTSIVGTLSNLVFNIILICIFKLGLDALYISFIIGQLSIFILLEYKLRICKSINRLTVSVPLLKKMIIYSAPLVVNSIAAWLLNGFGRVIIANNLGDEMNGLYSFANKFVNIISIIGSVVSMALVEEALSTIKDNKLNIGFSLMIENLFRFFLSIILLGTPVISIFYLFITNTEYYNSIYFIPFLMLYSVFLNMSINFGIVFKIIDKNKFQVITTMIGALFTIVVSYSLIKYIGIYAVILGQMVGAIAMIISRYIISNKFVEFKIRWLPIFLRSLLYLIVTYISINVNLIANAFIFIIVIIYVIYINLDIIKEFINDKKRRAT